MEEDAAEAPDPTELSEGWWWCDGAKGGCGGSEHATFEVGTCWYGAGRGLISVRLTGWHSLETQGVNSRHIVNFGHKTGQILVQIQY